MVQIYQILHDNAEAIGAAASIVLAVGAFVAGVSAAIAAFQLRATWRIYESQYNWWCSR